MQFTTLENETQLKKINDSVGSNIIFKHNPTCPISRSVLKRLELEVDQLPSTTPVYFLDLLAHRDLSDEIVGTFAVTHQSPQLLLINNGKCIYNESHYAISLNDAVKLLQEEGS